MFWVSLKKESLKIYYWLFDSGSYSYSHLDYLGLSLLHSVVKYPVVVSVIDSSFSYLMPSCCGQTDAKDFETIDGCSLASEDSFVG
jgi:hypothetical protein